MATAAVHKRADTNVSIGSDLQAGANDEPFDFQPVRRALAASNEPPSPVSIPAPVQYNSPNPAVTALLSQKEGWTAMCIEYFESQGWTAQELSDIHTDLVIKNGGPDELCCKLAEEAIKKKRVSALLVIPIPEGKREYLTLCVDQMVELDGDCQEYGAMRAALLGQQVNKLSKVLGN